MDKVKIKKVSVWTLIAVIITGIIEFLLKDQNLNIARCLYHFVIVDFFAMHFAFGLKDFYIKLFDNKYKVSLTFIVIFTILGFFMNGPIEITTWLFSLGKPLSLWYNFKFFAMIIVIFELLKIITDNKIGFSIAGTLVLAFSSAFIYNFNSIDGIILGAIFVICFKKIIDVFEEKQSLKKIFKYMLGMLIASTGCMYANISYVITFAYCYLALLIWIIIDKRKVFKENKKLILIEFLTVLFSTIVSIIISCFILNKVYFDSIISRQGVFAQLLSYTTDIALPFINYGTKGMQAGIISAFPVPLILAVIYMYNNEEHVSFFMPVVIINVILLLVCFGTIPDFISKVMFLSTNTTILSTAISFLNVLMLFYIITRVQVRIINMKRSIIMTEILCVIIALINQPIGINWFKYIIALEIALLSFLLFNNNDARYKVVLIFFMVIFTYISAFPVYFMI